MKYFILSLMVLWISACATTRAYENNLQQWAGRTQGELVEAWGQPSRMETLSDGGKKFFYFKENKGVKYVRDSESDGAKRLWDCKTIFVISPDKEVVGWKFEGPNCRQ